MSKRIILLLVRVVFLIEGQKRHTVRWTSATNILANQLKVKWKAINDIQFRKHKIIEANVELKKEGHVTTGPYSSNIEWIGQHGFSREHRFNVDGF